jgi:hypothetical protein
MMQQLNLSANDTAAATIRVGDSSWQYRKEGALTSDESK